MVDIRNLLEKKPDLQEVVEENVGQILQVARLYLKDGTTSDGEKAALVVGNTHLFYHPLAGHVRLMQAFVVCKELDEWCRVGGDALTRNQLIFCGDLNSCPNSGALKLLRDRKVAPDQCETWKNLYEYGWESTDCYYSPENSCNGSDPALEDALAPPKGDVAFHVAPPTIEFPDSFPQLVSGYDPIPEFSNYVVGFIETLDYIFISDIKDDRVLVVSSSAPTPTITEMQTYPAIPNEDYPSDHVSLACDFRWTSAGA
jgi:2',5'-phosphodiesterase